MMDEHFRPMPFATGFLFGIDEGSTETGWALDDVDPALVRGLVTALP